MFYYGWLGPLKINTNKNGLQRAAIDQGSLQNYKKQVINQKILKYIFSPNLILVFAQYVLTDLSSGRLGPNIFIGSTSS